MKSKTAAGLLGIFGGTFGIHHFYLGNNKRGILYACLFWTGIPQILGIIEGILLLIKDEDNFDRKYNFSDLSYYEYEEIKDRYRDLKRRRSRSQSSVSHFVSSLQDVVLSFFDDDHSGMSEDKLERLKRKQQEKRNVYRRSIFGKVKRKAGSKHFGWSKVLGVMAGGLSIGVIVNLAELLAGSGNLADFSGLSIVFGLFLTAAVWLHKKGKQVRAEELERIQEVELIKMARQENKLSVADVSEAFGIRLAEANDVMRRLQAHGVFDLHLTESGQPLYVLQGNATSTDKLNSKSIFDY